MTKRLLVSIVDDDVSVRESLPDLLNQLGYAARAFPSAEEFLASGYVDRTKCLILDVAMPGMSGPELQRQLATRGDEIPIIFITAQGAETMRSHLIELGAVEVLSKPFGDQLLLKALDAAFGVG